MLRDKGTAAVLGLDPDPDRLPEAFRPLPSDEPSTVEQRLFDWCRSLLEKTHDLFGVVKLQAAWFELQGVAGLAAMERISRQLRDLGLLVIADVKRADIEVSARAYARAWIGGPQPRSDAMTLVPWFGPKSLEPCIEVARESGTGAFLCAYTSNPSAEVLQAAQVRDEQPAWKAVAQMAADAQRDEDGRSPIGLVVGANRPQMALQLRREYPGLWFLAPGLGAQGADIDRVGDFLDQSGSGVLFPSSRALTFPEDGDVRGAAERFIERLDRVAPVH